MFQESSWNTDRNYCLIFPHRVFVASSGSQRRNTRSFDNFDTTGLLEQATMKQGAGMTQ